VAANCFPESVHGALPRPSAWKAAGEIGLDRAWQALLCARALGRAHTLPAQETGYRLHRSGSLLAAPPGHSDTLLLWRPGQGWAPAESRPAPVRDLLDLYLPVCGPMGDGCLVVGHLGQSLDGCIATRSGESCNVTGRANIEHLHRMRALSDAVLVGAETVARDDPRLTTRLVPGGSPVRVVLDPRRRLASHHTVFKDGEARTLVVCAHDRLDADALGEAEVIGIPAPGGRLALDALCDLLRRRGLHSIFVEGGGMTVSAFLHAGLLDRLQVAVSPLLIGEGRRGLCLPPALTMGDCLRPRCRIFRMGEDVLFDCEPGERQVPEKGGTDIGRIF
jgi:diaminohydroxyphosphoribosylaminopyrimidine deaminase/5-amino-6-(5-phosphoribosylamino)uracil reductase